MRLRALAGRELEFALVGQPGARGLPGEEARQQTRRVVGRAAETWWLVSLTINHDPTRAHAAFLRLMGQKMGCGTAFFDVQIRRENYISH